VLGRNGVLVLSSITGGDRKAEIESDKINQSFVLGNKVMVGTVNASPADFRSGVDDLIKAQALFRGWLDKLLTTPIQGLERYEEMIRALTEDHEAIKVHVEVDASQ
jgi:glucose 1-dehydrogenase